MILKDTLRRMHPVARNTGLLVTEMDDDTLVYDLESFRAVSLNGSAEGIRRLCDGTRDIGEIASLTEVSEAQTAKVLRDLDRNGLLEPGFDSISLVNRRKFLSSIAKGSATAAVAAPVVLAMTLPAAAQAASCLPSGSACQPGINDNCCTNCVQQGGQKICS